jgi:Ni,Fe-hydrogenase III small subunit
MIIKPLGAQVALSSQNNVSHSTLVYIVNTGAAATCNIQFANTVVYANVHVTNTFPVIIQKSGSDLLIGTSTMFAVPVAFKA